MKRLRIIVHGIVQGVGFRPFVYTLALRHNLRGSVINTSQGVVIEVEGEETSSFLAALRREAPPLSRIDEIGTGEIPVRGDEGFLILDSIDEGLFTLISPDVAVCDDCLREMFDPSDRRYLYPFINCTNCGPRYTITTAVPYDSPNTTMAVFEQCPSCLREYHDPLDRRFHAQPNACPVCGPAVEFVAPAEGRGAYSGGDPIVSAIAALREGAIVAVKGLGGFHLCCDASDRGAVERLRERKRRVNKPFALMASSLGSTRRFCHVTDDDARLLRSRTRPIVLLRKRDGEGLPGAVAPNNASLGFMLPYVPLHHLLFHYPLTPGTGSQEAHFDALVMTSGNLSEEPIVVGNADALARLSGIADAFLLHNRDIFMRVDDSVLQTSPVDAGSAAEAGREQKRGLHFFRRARGYVPEPIPLAEDGPDVLGCGADIKNTFTITRGRYAIVSQHIGDMENVETLSFFQESLKNLEKVYRARPVAISHDLHPRYLSTQWALRFGAERGVPCTGIQHHHAHIASVMAEEGIGDTVIGVAFDGTGYGTDGSIWGSEFILCSGREFRRLAHFRSIPLPGGERAIRECWRTAVSYVRDAAGPEETLAILEEAGLADTFGRDRIMNMLKVLGQERLSPLSSGAGRLFDAVSSLAGVCLENTFEGEAAIALESRIVHTGQTDDVYPFGITEGDPVIVDFSPMILAVLEDRRRKVGPSVIARTFHNTLCRVIADVVLRQSEQHGVRKVALSGGVFQNAYLLSRTVHQLRSAGFSVHTHRLVPANDGCISLGQAYIVRELLKHA